jgi:hypothetical protein
VIVELFSGIGRSLDPLDPEVVRIDFDPKTRPTICADVRFLPLRPGLRPKLVHASPPCKYFSNMRMAAFGPDWAGLGDSFDLVGAAFHAADYLEAERITLETPMRGMLASLLHKRTVIYKAGDYHHKPTNFYSSKRVLENSKIPQDVMKEVVG